MPSPPRFGRLRAGRVLLLTGWACAAALADTASSPPRDTVLRAVDSPQRAIDTGFPSPSDSATPSDTADVVDTAAGGSDTTALAAPPAVPPGPRPWREEIDSLLAYVGGLRQAVFIRNESEYNAAQAVAHLRLKWRRQDGRIRSTEDFILQCATRSSFTGSPYRVRFADGTVRPAAEVLREELGRLRRGGARAER